MTKEVIYNTDNYAVLLTESALNEAGTENNAPGYKVVNKETGITEHTAMCLPAAIFQADSFDRTLSSLLEKEDAAQTLTAVVEEDATIN